MVTVGTPEILACDWVWVGVKACESTAEEQPYI